MLPVRPIDFSMDSFTPLAPEHYPLLAPFFEHQPFRLAEYCLALLVAWRNVGDWSIRFAIDGGTLFMVARNRRQASEDHLALPLPVDDYTPARLAGLCAHLGLSEFHYVPQAYIERHGFEEIRKVFRVFDQPDYEDYVYESEALAALAGRRFSKKRNLIHQFEREYAEPGRVNVERLRPGRLTESLAFLDHWFGQVEARTPGDCGVEEDRQVALNLMGDFEALALEGIGVRVDGRIVGLGVAARLNAEMGVLCIEKALDGYKGLYQFLDRECAARLFVGKYKYMNKEGDMGVEGLRRAKRSYHPVRRIKCYRFERID